MKHGTCLYTFPRKREVVIIAIELLFVEVIIVNTFNRMEVWLWNIKSLMYGTTV